jgi:hypothetical protein
MLTMSDRYGTETTVVLATALKVANFGKNLGKEVG